MNNKNLICFFSWGRAKLVEQCFNNLLKHTRPQDRILVVDQGMHNLDFYAKYRDKIDYLIFLKNNYKIGSMWHLFQVIAGWLKHNKRLFNDSCGWYPDYVNIVESDAVGEKGWIDKLLPLFELERVTMVSGYIDPFTNYTKDVRDEKILYTESSTGVQVMMRTEHFLKIPDLPVVTQDLAASNWNKNQGFRVANMNLIKHIGWHQRRKKGFFKE